MSLRRGWYEGEAIGKQGVKRPGDCKRLGEHSIQKVDDAIGRDDVLSGFIEDGLQNVSESYKAPGEWGLKALDTCDEAAALLDVDVTHEDDSGPYHLSELYDSSPDSGLSIQRHVMTSRSVRMALSRRRVISEGRRQGT